MTEEEKAKREDMAAGLIALAEEIKRPNFPMPASINYTIDANIWGFTPTFAEGEETGTDVYGILAEESLTNLRRLVRGLGGRKKEKHYGTGGFTCTRHFGEHVRVCISAARETVCRRVPTGNKIIHAAQYIPETVEEEVEWVCEEKLLGATYYDGGS